MKQISILKGKPKKLETLWSDGYYTNVIWTGEKYRLEGKQQEFETLAALQEHYKGTIKQMRAIK